MMEEKQPSFAPEDLPVALDPSAFGEMEPEDAEAAAANAAVEDNWGLVDDIPEPDGRFSDVPA